MAPMRSCAIAVLSLVLAGAGATAFAATLDTPTVAVTSASRASIHLDVQAGASGAPGGFSVEWMTQADYVRLGGWPADPYDPSLYVCDFDGVPTINVTPGLTSFQLTPGQTANVEMGDIFDETGLYANYYDDLPPGTTYVFRAFAIAAPGYTESPRSGTLSGSTDPEHGDECTFTQGFWKNHPGSWPVASLTLGTVSYTKTQLLSILGTPAQGNGLVSLAHQLIAARLNIAAGALAPSSITTAIGQADALIGSLVVPPVGGGSLAPSQTSALNHTLDEFNEGEIPGTQCASTPARGTSWGRLKQLYR